MNKRETVKVLLDSIQKGDLEIAESMLADDFQFRSSTVEPINKEAWLDMSANLKTAFPDLHDTIEELIAEVLKQPRDAAKDKGADERSTASIVARILTVADVGPGLGGPRCRKDVRRLVLGAFIREA